MLATDRRFERIVHRSFSKLLRPKGYQRDGNQFYFDGPNVGKLIFLERDLTHPHFRNVAIFTVRVHVLSKDDWAMTHLNEPFPTFPFEHPNPYVNPIVLYRHLGRFYGKNQGDHWIALDDITPETDQIQRSRELIQTRVLPYLDRINTIDDILKEQYSDHKSSIYRMRMLAWLGRTEESRAELAALIARRHQRGYRMIVCKVAQEIGLL